MDWLRAVWKRYDDAVPKLFAHQSAVLAGVLVLVVVIAVTQTGSGSSSRASVPSPVGSGTGSAPASASIAANPTATTPTKVEQWQGTVRVGMSGEEVADGPPRVAGLRFGLAMTGARALVGSGNLAAWTESDKTPTASACVALLTTGAQYQLTLRVGDRLCIAALDGRTASAEVADEGTGSDGTPYIDLDVIAYVP